MQRRAADAGAAGDRILEKISNMGDASMPIEDRVNALRQLRGSGGLDPFLIDRRLLEKIGRLRDGLHTAQAEQENMRLLIARLTAAPHFPALYRSEAMTPYGTGAVVQTGNEKRVVSLGDGVSIEELSTGDEVLLSEQRNCLVARTGYASFLTGEVATYSRRTADGRLILRSREEEIVVLATPAMMGLEIRAGDAVLFSREAGLAFERIEQSKGDEFFLEETPSDSFDEIGGLEREIRQLKRLLSLHIFHGEITSKYRSRRKRAVLMEGPPGNGKTKAARAACAWLATLTKSGRSRFINVKPGALNSMWWGETESRYGKVFAAAGEAAAQDPDVPVVIFWDEVDAIGGNRGEQVHRIDDRVLNRFMAELDGFNDRGNVVILAATNRLDALDPALTRPGRLGDLVLHFPSPNRRAARAILSRHMPADIPYSCNGEGPAAARELLLDTAVDRIFAQNSDTEIANLTFRDGKRRLVRAADLISGAQLESIAQSAIESACVRETEGGPSGVAAADVHAAVADFFASAPRVLTPRSARGYLRDLPQDVDVVRVDLIARKVRNADLYRAEVA